MSLEKKIIKNGISYDLNGFKYISIKGSPKERGYAYGYFSSEDFKKVQEMMKFMCFNDYGRTWDFFIEAGVKVLKNVIKENFLEIYQEMEGITEGIIAGGTETTLDEVIAWNNYFTLLESWYSTYDNEGGTGRVKSSRKEGGGQSDRCSAFIAVGSYTKNGEIVVAHNSFSNFIDGQYFKYIVDIQPEKGHRILMQSLPGWIWSGTDFFITGKGIIGTETTIGGFLPYEQKFPISCRIRKAMQYGNTLDEYVDILVEGNSGDYANSWLFGDTNTNEILRIELGLKYYSVERTKDGYFVGFNGTYDPQIRNLECSNQGFDDVRRHQGARKVRLTDLMEENKGKLDVELSKIIIADHYDVYLKKENPCSRTVCSHYELDAREYMSQADRPKPYQPRGVLDGFIVDTALAKKMSFIGKYGSSCDIPFNANDFFNKHRQWIHLKPYVFDRPFQPWTEFKIYDSKEKKDGKSEEKEEKEQEVTITSKSGGKRDKNKKYTIKLRKTIKNKSIKK